MKIASSTTLLLVLLCAVSSFTALNAQQVQHIAFTGAPQRAPVTLKPGVNALQVSGLKPGASYQLIANHTSAGEPNLVDFHVVGVQSLANYDFNTGVPNLLRFKALMPDVEIKVESAVNENLYLSLTCSSETAHTEKNKGQPEQSLLQVQTGMTPTSLVQDVLVGGGCFQISNVTFSGVPEQIGMFTNGLTNIGFDQGIILGTGDINVAPGPNDSDGASQGYGFSTPDVELENLTNGNTFDMASVEFDFVPTQAQVSFEYAFASEEYCEYVNTQFNDVFGFFISGPGIVGTQNIALIPATNTPVTINNVNHLVNSGLYTHNTPPGGKNCGGIPPANGPAVQELQYDGFTKKMVAIANVTPCQTYHIKIKIADVGDGVWDSAVFLRANSFNAGNGVLVSPAYPGSQGEAYENCQNGTITFRRGNGNVSLPQPVAFSVGGTATPGLDYIPLPNSVVIPAGEMEISIPVTVLPDLLTEGQETIQLLIPNTCSCSQSVVNFVINDRPVISAEGFDQFMCIGELSSLHVNPSGGILNGTYSYQWNTGDTTAFISPSTSGTYEVTVSDGCSVPATVALQLSYTACSTCQSETYVKTLGTENVRGLGIYDSHDGNFYLSGLKKDSALITKITPGGDVLWARAFDIQAGVRDIITELIIDSDGMVVGCGQSGELQSTTQGFVFRYNPVSNNMLWLNTYGNNFSPSVGGILELPGGNYLVYDNPHANADDNRLMEFRRIDGTIVMGSPLTEKFNLGVADNFNSAVIEGGILLGVGRYTNGANPTNARTAISRIDLSTGSVDWSRLTHVGPNQPALLYGSDLIFEGNAVVAMSYGSETNTDLTNSQIFLQQTDLSGNLMWMRRFNIPGLSLQYEVADELISVSDGYVLYLHQRGSPSDLYLIKTDKAGMLQWAKKIDYGTEDYSLPDLAIQSQLLTRDNHLYLLSSTFTAGPGDQMLLIKTNMDGTVEGQCDYIQAVTVDFSDVPNPVNLPVSLLKVPFDDQAVAQPRTPTSTELPMENQCKLFVEDNIYIALCPGQTTLINGATVSQDTLIQLEIPSGTGCDTLRTYTVELKPYNTRTENVVLCPGDAVVISGESYSQAGTVIDTISALTGCDTIVTYNISTLPYPTRAEEIHFCAGSSVNIGGVLYTQAGTVIDTIPSLNACDTIVTYTLIQSPYNTRSESRSFCPGQSVTIDGQLYFQSGTVVDTVASATGCDTIVIYTLTQLPFNVRSEQISLCQGESVTIGGVTYNSPVEVTLTIPTTTSGACDTIVTYHVTVGALITRSETITICPGESVTLGGVTYTHPAVVTQTHAATTGCDTLVTYTIQFATPAPSTVKVICPQAITLDQQSGSMGAIVTYTAPSANSDCVCPGINLQQTSGLPSGSLFPIGVTPVCFSAKDSCGQSASCCFNITVQEAEACDTKINGCVKYELLTITRDAAKNWTYRIRVTNNCFNKLLYTAIQIPDGLIAISPANFSTYTAPSGNTYAVRSPNYSPQYSIRFSSISDSINLGESEIFKYKIPAQADVTFINVVSRLKDYVYVSAHLNTFYCPIGVTPVGDARPLDDRQMNGDGSYGRPELFLFPNPTGGALFADLSPWEGQQLQVRVMDSRGVLMQERKMTAGFESQDLELSQDLASGLYFLEVVDENGERFVERFVVEK